MPPFVSSALLDSLLASDPTLFVHRLALPWPPLQRRRLLLPVGLVVGHAGRVRAGLLLPGGGQRHDAVHGRRLLRHHRPLGHQRTVRRRLLLSARLALGHAVRVSRGRLLCGERRLLDGVHDRQCVRDHGPERGRRVHAGQLLRDHWPQRRQRAVRARLHVRVGRRVGDQHGLPRGPLLSARRERRDGVRTGHVLRNDRPVGARAVHGGQLLCDHGPERRHGRVVRALCLSF